jgi:hypothetical protein
MLLSLLISTVIGAGPTDTVLLEIVKDAQIASAAKVRHGTLTAQIEYMRVPSEEEIERGSTSKTRHAKARITAHWDGEDELLAVQVGDPDQLLTHNHNSELEASRTRLILCKGNKLHFYNPYTNVLYIRQANRVDLLRSVRFVEVIPITNWQRCCPPDTMQGRAWAEFLSLRSPLNDEGARVHVEQTDKNHVRYERHDPGRGIARIDFSLEFGGNPIAYAYLKPERPNATQEGTLTWRKDASGTVTLAERTHLTRDEKDPDLIRSTYRMTVESCRISATASPAISFSYLKSQLPRDAMVADYITNRDYPLTPRAIADDRLKGLAEKLKAGGLMRGDGR